MRKFWLVIYIFCFLFAPPLIPNVNFSFILGAFAATMLLFKYSKRLINLFKNASFAKFVILFVLYVFVFLCAYAINSITRNEDIFDNFMLNMYSIVLNYVITFVCGIYLVFRCEDLKIDKNELIRLFIYAGLIQFLIALLALINESFRSFTIDLMMKETNERLMNSPWLLERRFYGFSNNLLDLFGFGMGILSALPLFYASANNQKKYLLAILPMIFVSMLNSRTGIIIFIIGLLVWVVGLIVSKRINVMRIIAFTIPSLVAFFLGVQMISYYSPHTLEWIKNDLTSFVEPDTTGGTATAIYSEDFWVLPDADQILIGTGHNASAYSSSKVDGQTHTDNGYINEIWKVGVIGFMIYFILNFYIIKQSYLNERNVIYKSMYVFFGLAMAAFLVKGSLIGYNPGNVIIYTMFINSVVSSRGEEK